MFGSKKPSTSGPAPAFATDEQQRGDGLTARIGQITADPANPYRSSLPLYRMAAQDAYGNAAAHTAQPEKVKRRWGR